MGIIAGYVMRTLPRVRRGHQARRPWPSQDSFRVRRNTGGDRTDGSVGAFSRCCVRAASL